MRDLEAKPGCLGRVLGLLAGGRGAGAEPAEAVWPYRRKRYLLSRAEASFYGVLRGVAAERGWVVCPKVNLNDLLYLEKGTEGRQGWLNRVNRKHADYVLCEAKTMSPVAVVELDDASHGGAKTKARDAVKDRALAAAGLPMVRMRAAKGYVPAEVARAIEAAVASP